MASKKKKERFAPNVACAACGKQYWQGEMMMISDAISRHKPACSYECNVALGQVELKKDK